MGASRTRDVDERGFTLVEVMVASLLLVVVVTVIGGIMASSQKTQVVVASVNTATRDGQVVTNSLDNGISNTVNSFATSIPMKLTSPSGSNQMVTGLVVGNGATAVDRCEAWYYSATEHTVRFLSSDNTITAPTGTTLDTWTLLADGVTPISGSSIFSLTGTRELNVNFKVDAGNDPAVPFQSTIYSRSNQTGNSACF